MRFFFIILLFACQSCDNKSVLNSESSNSNIVIKDSIYYDYHDDHLTFDVLCIDSIPFSHLIILDAGQGINEKIDFSGDEKSFFSDKYGEIKMFSYFSYDTLQCKYKIYNDTLEFTFISEYDLINQTNHFFLIKRKNNNVFNYRISK